MSKGRTQAVEMTVEDAEGLVSGLLAREAGRVVASLGWGDDMEQREAYVSSNIHPRLEAAEALRVKVDAFHFSDKALFRAWGPILAAEFVTEAVAQVVRFASQVARPGAPVEYPESLIPQLRGWYPGKVDSLATRFSAAYDIRPPLAKALLFKNLGLEEAAQEEAKGVVFVWLETGFVALADGDIKRWTHKPPERAFAEVRLPLSDSQRALVRHLLPGWAYLDENDERERARVMLTITRHFGLGKADVMHVAEEVVADYFHKEYWALEGLMQILHRAELLGIHIVPRYEEIVTSAPWAFGRVLDTEGMGDFLAQLRQVCDLAGMSSDSRTALIEALWADEKARRRGRYLHFELQLIEALFDGDEQVRQVRALVKRHLAEGGYLEKLLELADTYGFDDLVPEIREAIVERDERQKAAEEEHAREEAEKEVVAEAARQEWVAKLTKAVQLLEVEPGSGGFLVEAYPERPLARGRPGCVIATSVTSLVSAPVARAVLQTLRDFRNGAIASLPKGKSLIACYERTAPPVAKWAARNRLVRASFWWPFIRPSVFLLRHRPLGRLGGLVDLLVITIFLVGLVWTSFLSLFTKER